ncbi:ATP-dependent helicase, partial [Streptomyces sp. SID9124]|nr:ATP-dependent helicase [Streptomyces sp. SID9124]
MSTAPPPPDADDSRLPRCAAVFLPGTPPRRGRVAFWDPADAPLPETAEARSEEITVVRPSGTGGEVRTRDVPALLLPVEAALPLLARARHLRSAHPATRAWGA